MTINASSEMRKKPSRAAPSTTGEPPRAVSGAAAEARAAGESLGRGFIEH
ncbi:hypothetical protein SALBM311S_00648 [Streptomyces alboniger]